MFLLQYSCTLGSMLCTHGLSARSVLSFLLVLPRIIARPLSSSLFPFTTLFRSRRAARTSPCTPRALPCSCAPRSEEHTSELQSLRHLVCRLLLEKKTRRQAPPVPPERRVQKRHMQTTFRQHSS